MKKAPRLPKRYWDDLKWGRCHHTELLDKYKDKWVAIVNKKIVSSGKDLGKVKAVARKKTNIRNVPVIYVECGEHIYAC